MLSYFQPAIGTPAYLASAAARLILSDTSNVRRNVRNNVNAISSVVSSIRRAFRPSRSSPFRSGTGPMAPSAATLGTTVVDQGTVIVRNPKRWIQSADRAHAAARRAARKLGSYVIPRQIVKGIEYFRITAGTDNKQGRCCWFSYPILNPNELDQYALKYGLDLRSAELACQLWWIKEILRFRNACTFTSEIDLWICWPKRDIPRTDDVKFDDGTTTYPLSSAWFYGVDPPFMKYGFAPTVTYPGSASDEAGTYVTAEVENQNADYKVSPMPYNDWLASPYENQYLMDNFRVKKVCKKTMNPGDMVKFITGAPGQFIYPFDQVEMDLGGDAAAGAEAFARLYSHMRRCGPILLFRFRGVLGHLETTPGNLEISPTMGLFNYDLAIEHIDCCNRVVNPVSASMSERGVYTEFATSSQGQGLASDTVMFAQEFGEHRYDD